MLAAAQASAWVNLFPVAGIVERRAVCTMADELTRQMIATASTRLSNSRSEWLLVASVLILYVLARMLLIPARAEFTHAFTHDSAYLATTAGNVVSGKGYVNDALWLVFMMPQTLPMPYHNANPLFPTLAAGIAFVGQYDVFRSGFVVAALGS